MKKQAHKSLEPPEEAHVREINHRFHTRLPHIIDEISTSLMVIEPAVNDVIVPLREFLDYLDFEISKARHTIDKDSWESIVDVNKTVRDKAWLLKLEQLRKEFDVEHMTSSVNFIRSMLARVQETFDMKLKGPPVGGP